MEDIIINHKGLLYVIVKDQFETLEDAYQRGWFIINNKSNYENNNKLISMSFINNYKKKGMKWGDST